MDLLTRSWKRDMGPINILPYKYFKSDPELSFLELTQVRAGVCEKLSWAKTTKIVSANLRKDKYGLIKVNLWKSFGAH